MPRWIPMMLSVVVPGLGQWATGRFLSGALFLFLCSWFRLTMSAFTWLHRPVLDPVDGAIWGAFVFPEPMGMPLLVVLTALTPVLHLWAGWDARRPAADAIQANG